MLQHVGSIFLQIKDLYFGPVQIRSWCAVSWHHCVLLVGASIDVIRLWSRWPWLLLRLRPIPVLGIGIGPIPVVSVWYRYRRYCSRYQNRYQSAVTRL